MKTTRYTAAFTVLIAGTTLAASSAWADPLPASVTPGFVGGEVGQGGWLSPAAEAESEAYVPGYVGGPVGQGGALLPSDGARRQAAAPSQEKETKALLALATAVYQNQGNRGYLAYQDGYGDIYSLRSENWHGTLDVERIVLSVTPHNSDKTTYSFVVSANGTIGDAKVTARKHLLFKTATKLSVTDPEMQGVIARTIAFWANYKGPVTQPPGQGI